MAAGFSFDALYKYGPKCEDHGRECKSCHAWLDEQDVVEYGNLCRDCVFKHEPCGDAGCACALQLATCWHCGSKVTKIVVPQDKRAGYPYPDQVYACANEACDLDNKRVVRCKGCFETTVDWTMDFDDTEIWDDLEQCTACGAVFCPCCNQSNVGCRHASEEIDGVVDEFDEEYLYCTDCPLVTPYRSRKPVKMVVTRKNE